MTYPINFTSDIPATMGQHQGLMLTIFILSLAILGYQAQNLGILPKKWSLTPRSTNNKVKTDTWSLTSVAAAYRQYEKLANAETSRMRTSYAKLTGDQARISQTIDYGAKLDQLEEAGRVNGEATGGIADLAVRELGQNASELEAREGGNLFRMRETLLHFVRDWSEEGEDERSVIFRPILEVLKGVEQGKRGEMKVLIPGSGLARLAWEISQLGYRATANELSWYMNLGLRFLIHPSATSKTHQHTIQPFSHRFSNQKSNNHLFRSVTFPDVLPRYSSHFQIAEDDFLKHNPANGELYDYVVTQFFIDTGTNVVATLQQIRDLLKPGGKWINLGPLLWAGGGSVAMELSLEEVLALAKEVGLEILGESGEEIGQSFKRRTVECEYTADRLGTFQRIYHAEFWIATKT